MKNKLINLIPDIFSKTIGADLISVKPTNEEPPECPPEYDHPVLVHPLNGDKPYWKNQETRFDGEAWDAIEITPTPDMFDDEDWQVLTNIGFTKEALVDYKYDKTNLSQPEYYIVGRNLHIRTSQSSWLALGGRHWCYNIDSKQVSLICMN